MLAENLHQVQDNIQQALARRSEPKSTGRNVLLVDDVISTGGSMKAMKELAEKAGAHVIGEAAILAEGDAAKRKDIIYLEPLPLFEAE